MKTLHLMRHAKSSWQSPELDDHDRELNERGRRDAPRMGEALAEFVGAQPVHSSGAVRARLTLEGMCSTWPSMAAQQHVVEESLYTFDHRQVLEWIQNLRGDSAECFLIGHNPAFTDLCNVLTGASTLDNLPTAGYLQLSIPVAGWADVAGGTATLERWLFPRDLAAR